MQYYQPVMEIIMMDESGEVFVCRIFQGSTPIKLQSELITAPVYILGIFRYLELTPLEPTYVYLIINRSA